MAGLSPSEATAAALAHGTGGFDSRIKPASSLLKMVDKYKYM